MRHIDYTNNPANYGRVRVEKFERSLDSSGGVRVLYRKGQSILSTTYLIEFTQAEAREIAKLVQGDPG